MATIGERPGSPRLVVSSDPSVERQYVIHGTTDEAEARAIVVSYSPIWDSTTGRVVVRDSIEIGKQGRALDVWDATVAYKKSAKPEVGLVKYAFSTKGGSQKITHAIADVAQYTASGTAPDMQGAIGVTKDSIEGVEVPLPQFTWTETWKMPIAMLTDAYKVTLAGLTARVNNATFRGFAIGEVRFDGVDGSIERQDSQETALNPELTFAFSASPNAVGLAVGPITGIAKKGWEYAWVLYEDDTSQHRMVKSPIAVYVQQVLFYGNFAGLGIG